MNSTFRGNIRGALALTFGLVAGCGGGGGSDPEPPPPPPPPLVELAVSPAFAAREATTSQAYVPPVTLALAVSQVPESGLRVFLEFANSGIVKSAEIDYTTATTAAISIQFKPPVTPGTYSDTFNVHVCYDLDCRNEVTNSPFPVALEYRVVQEPDFAADALLITGQAPVGHDVLDAEYSPGLDAVVMIASTPANALHVHYPETGEAKSIALGAAPRSVSLSPDGLTAAVAHDSLITLVDLDRLDDPLVDPTTVLNVAMDVYEAVVPGNGYVYAFPVSGYLSSYLSVIEIATGAETKGGRYGFAGSMPARVHPSADRIYGVSSGSPDDVHRVDITGGASITHYDSMYHGDYDNCHNLWLHEAGERVFTACGFLYRTSNVQAHDIVYAGSLHLVAVRYADFRGWHGSEIKSLSHTAEGDEIALLEESNDECVITQDDCRTQLSLYHGTHYILQGRYTVPPLEVDGTSHRQRGTHVFHSADGTKRYLVTRLEAMADPAREFWLGAANVAGNVPVSTPESQPSPTLRPTAEPYAAAPQVDFQALPHDVVDAEFSAVLNAIVMVSRHPSPALYVYDVVGGDEFSIPLPRPPYSVSVSPDGLHAAAGQDGLITHVTLSADAPDVTQLDASLPTIDLSLGGNGWVYALSFNGESDGFHSIQVATNEETVTGGSSVRTRVHPDGTRLYLPTSSAVTRRSTSSGVVGGGMAINYGSNTVCGDAWLDQSADRLITACGRVLELSEVSDFDLVLEGALPMLVNPFGEPWRAAFASQSNVRSEIAVIENDPTRCVAVPTHPCLSHVNLYSSDTLTLTQRYALAPVMVGDETYRQRGMFVFHSTDGAERYIVSQLHGMARPWAGFYVSRLATPAPGP